MSEQTLIKTLDLPCGQDWAWYADANIVGLGRHLDAEGRERALNEVQDHWRRSCLRVVGGDDEPTRPLQMPRPTLREVIEAL